MYHIDKTRYDFSLTSIFKIIFKIPPKIFHTGSRMRRSIVSLVINYIMLSKLRIRDDQTLNLLR